MNKFKIGDLVRLKSGSEVMTVSDLNNSSSSPSVRLQWYCKHTFEMKYIYLHPDTLQLETTT